MKYYIYKIFLLFFALLFVHCSKSSPSTNKPTTLQISVLRDSAGELSIEDIAKLSSRFLPMKDTRIREGYGPDVVWVKADILNKTKIKTTGRLFLDWGTVALAECFLPSEEGDWKQLKAGNTIPMREWEIKEQPPSFPVTVEPDSVNTAYIRLSGNFFKEFSFSFRQEKEIQKYNKYRFGIQAAFGLLILIIILYNLFLFSIYRNSLHLWYCGYISLLWMLFFITQGDANTILWPNTPLLQNSSSFFIMPALAFFIIKFVKEFLQLQNLKRSLDRILNIFAYYYLVLLFVFYLLPRDVCILIYSSSNIIFTFTICLIIAYARKKGLASARMMLLPFGIYTTAICLTAFHYLELLPHHSVAVFAPIIIVPLDLIYFSAILRYRIRETVKEITQGSLLADRDILLEREAIQSTKELKGHLKPDDIPILIKKLKHEMEINKLYLLEDLRVGQLAAAMGIKSYLLTELLNQNLKISFPRLLQIYRIGEVIRSMDNNPTQTILSAAFASGFQSRSVFNSSFKELTGLTPREYVSIKKRL